MFRQRARTLFTGLLAWDHRRPTIYWFACAGSQMARNLFTRLSGIDLVCSVSQNQTVCLVLRLVLHSAVGGECTQAHLWMLHCCVTVPISAVMDVEFCASGLAYTQIHWVFKSHNVCHICINLHTRTPHFNWSKYEGLTDKLRFRS